MAGMQELLNVAMTQAELERNSNPLANNVKALIGGVSRGLEERKKEKAGELDAQLKALEIVEKHQKIQQQQQEQQRKANDYSTIRNMFFSRVGGNGGTVTAGVNGITINTPAAKISEMLDDLDVSYDENSGFSVTKKANKVPSITPYEDRLLKIKERELKAKEQGITGGGTDKTFTDADKLRDRVLEEQNNYLRTTIDPTFEEVDELTKKRWKTMLEKADKMQGIEIKEDAAVQPKINDTSEKSGGIGNKVGKFFGSLFERARGSNVPPQIKQNVVELKKRGASEAEIKQYLDDMGY